jgi:pimeloyl-ACP methyl ester carboxylesterase
VKTLALRAVADNGSFTVEVAGGSISGHRVGHGPPALVIHGGPGLSGEYIESLTDELGDVLETVHYEQRGVPPTTVGEPFTIEAHVEDAIGVLDALDLERVWVVGHSWGGHLAMHIAAARPERVLGLIAIDPLGAVADGGEKALEENLTRRLTAEVAGRVNALDNEVLAGRGGEAEIDEVMRLVWPFYFADPGEAPPMPSFRWSVPAYSATWDSIRAHFADETLVSGLPRYPGPALFVHGRESPVPPTESEKSARLIEGAQVHIVDRAGHFPWLERPGVVARSVRQFV